MDPFERLPPEPIQQIIVYTDFAMVESLILASRRINSVLQVRPIIVQDLILSNPITAVPEIQKLCYNISSIHNSIHCTDLAHYRQIANVLRISPIRNHFVLFDYLREYNALLVPASPSSSGNLTESSTGFERPQKTVSRSPEWRSTEFHDLDAYSIWNIIDKRVSERIWTAAALLSDLGLEPPSYGHYPLQHLESWLAKDPEGEVSSRTAWAFPQETPIPFFPSLDLPAAAGDKLSTPTSWSPTPTPVEIEVTDAGRLAPRTSGESKSAWDGHRVMCLENPYIFRIENNLGEEKEVMVLEAVAVCEEKRSTDEEEKTPVVPKAKGKKDKETK
ncbi:hypothetical protein BDV12DRAFT_195435 [Aspergillus spectabilis]